MRNILSAATAFVAAAVLTGCAIGPTSFGPSSVNPAVIYSDNLVYPASNTSSTQYNLDTDDFEIRGTVMAQGESTNILGIIASGDNGYELLLEEARLQGGDDVMNVRTDVQHTNILTFYAVVSTTLTGQAVRWK